MGNHWDDESKPIDTDPTSKKMDTFSALLVVVIVLLVLNFALLGFSHNSNAHRLDAIEQAIRIEKQ